MHFLYFVEVIIALLIILVFLTQVFVPLWRVTPLFPIFRREYKLETKLEEKRQEALEAKIQRDIEAEQRGIEAGQDGKGRTKRPVK